MVKPKALAPVLDEFFAARALASTKARHELQPIERIESPLSDRASAPKQGN